MEGRQQRFLSRKKIGEERKQNTRTWSQWIKGKHPVRKRRFRKRERVCGGVCVSVGMFVVWREESGANERMEERGESLSAIQKEDVLGG